MAGTKMNKDLYERIASGRRSESIARDVRDIAGIGLGLYAGHKNRETAREIAASNYIRERQLEEHKARLAREDPLRMAQAKYYEGGGSRSTSSEQNLPTHVTQAVSDLDDLYTQYAGLETGGRIDPILGYTPLPPEAINAAKAAQIMQMKNLAGMIQAEGAGHLLKGYKFPAEFYATPTGGPPPEPDAVVDQPAGRQIHAAPGDDLRNAVDDLRNAVEAAVQRMTSGIGGGEPTIPDGEYTPTGKPGQTIIRGPRLNDDEFRAAQRELLRRMNGAQGGGTGGP